MGDILQSADVQKAAVLYLYGPRNEMCEIVKMGLHQQKGLEYRYVGDGDPPGDDADGVVLVWRLEDEEQLAGNYRVVNILKEL